MSLNAAAERLGYAGSSQDSTWEIFVATWVDARPMPAKSVFDLEVAKMAEESRIKAIKTKSGEIILARYPSWKQANLQARFTELVDKVQSGGTLTAQEQMEKDGIKSAWAWAKLVRSESDRLEADPNATANWPA